MPETNAYILSGYRATRRHSFLPTKKTARNVPLLVTPAGRPAASLFHHLAGPYAGGLWVCSGVTSDDLFPDNDEAMGEAFVTLLDRMLGTASLVDITPRFVSDSEGVRMEVFATVVNHGTTRQELEVHASLAPAKGRGVWHEESTSVRLCSGVSRDVHLLRAKADAFDWEDFSVVCRLRVGGETIDTIKTSIDLRDALWWMERCKSTSGGAFVESTVWAHAHLDGDEIRHATEQFLREKFAPHVIEPSNRWWTTGGGRTVQGLDGLAYYYDRVEQDPQVLAALMRVTYHVCSAEALSGIPRILQKDEPSPSEWLYLNFAAVSLAALLEPETVRKDCEETATWEN